MANQQQSAGAEEQQTPPRGVHLVGSVPLRDAEEVFATTTSLLDGRLRRIPDGETGVRSNWIRWQIEFLARSPQVEMLPPDAMAYAPGPSAQLRPGVSSDEITFESLGYADAARASYAVFSRLKREMVIPANVRFQVSLPTPIATITAFFRPPDQAAVEPAYERALLRELDQITEAVPHHDLAIQWDVAIEFAILEGVSSSYLAGHTDTMTLLLERLIRLGNYIPAEAQLGYHLCYGDAGHRHFKEPADTTTLVTVANGLSAGVKRPINWIHLPVPRTRDDGAYFAPLRALRLHPRTELYLGLVHLHDGVEGAQRRIAAARRAVADFGVATECGMGRRLPATIPDLLRLHAEVAAPVM
ncbi:MAG TPA: hypothetical protein VKT52_03655 [Ktedonobacterales bacterium]|nr:hypothetical protein [Ktedonobacterales bacterium]